MLNEGVYLSPLIGVISKLRAATPCFLCTVQSSSLISIYGILDEEKKTISEKHDARSKNAGWGALSEQKNEVSDML